MKIININYFTFKDFGGANKQSSISSFFPGFNATEFIQNLERQSFFKKNKSFKNLYKQSKYMFSKYSVELIFRLEYTLEFIGEQELGEHFIKRSI